MSIIRDGFRSLYRSGAWFTENFVPNLLKKAGLPQGLAAKSGHGIGGLLGLGSLVVGAGFCMAIPVSFPMFTTAVTVYATHGLMMAATSTAVLAGTGTVVMAAGLGMCRALKKDVSALLAKARGHVHRKPSAPPAPEETGFNVPGSPTPNFNNAVKGATALPVTAAPAPAGNLQPT